LGIYLGCSFAHREATDAKRFDDLSLLEPSEVVRQIHCHGPRPTARMISADRSPIDSHRNRNSIDHLIHSVCLS